MQRRLKERLIGAAVLVMLAVIFIPMVLDNTSETGSEITRTNIPSRPDTEFSSRIIPVAEPPETLPPETMPPETMPPEMAEDEPGSVTRVPEAVVMETPAAPASGSGRPEPVTAPPGADDVGLIAWVVQLGSFSNAANADALKDRLRQAGFTAFVEPLQQQSNTVYRVRVGPELLKSEAQALHGRIREQMQIDGIVIQYP